MVPSLGARSSFCIFIASTTSSCWPAVTASPGATETVTTLPGMIARTSSGPLVALAARPRLARSRRDAIRSDSDLHLEPEAVHEDLAPVEAAAPPGSRSRTTRVRTPASSRTNRSTARGRRLASERERHPPRPPVFAQGQPAGRRPAAPAGPRTAERTATDGRVRHPERLGPSGTPGARVVADPGWTRQAGPGRRAGPCGIGRRVRSRTPPAGGTSGLVSSAIGRLPVRASPRRQPPPSGGAGRRSRRPTGGRGRPAA